MTYITVQDVRDAGLIDDTKFPDQAVEDAIEVWQEFIDRACRQWFEERALTFRVDGTDSDTLHFGVPIITIEHLKINDSATALDTNLYKVYSAKGYPDDRRNPRIKLVEKDEADIYSAPLIYGKMKFRKGRQNQEIKGTFGFIEENGEAPEMIKRALTKLVIEKLTKPIYVDPSVVPPVPPPPIVGALISEKTDGHSKTWAQAGGSIKPQAPGLSGITSDQEILDIIRLYKAPIGIATPTNITYD